MPTVPITDTEINPTDVAGYGGGRKELPDTELSPTYTYYGSTVVTETEINPTDVTGAGGGRRTATETEINPTHKDYGAMDTQALGKTKGFDFRGKGFRA